MIKKDKEIFGQPNQLYNFIQSNNVILHPIKHLYKDIQILFFILHRSSLLKNRKLVSFLRIIASL